MEVVELQLAPANLLNLRLVEPQLVEALMVLILVVEYNVVPYLGPTINVEDLVRTANTIFLQVIGCYS